MADTAARSRDEHGRFTKKPDFDTWYQDHVRRMRAMPAEGGNRHTILSVLRRALSVPQRIVGIIGASQLWSFTVTDQAGRNAQGVLDPAGENQVPPQHERRAVPRTKSEPYATGGAGVPGGRWTKGRIGYRRLGR